MIVNLRGPKNSTRNNKKIGETNFKFLNGNIYIKLGNFLTFNIYVLCGKIFNFSIGRGGNKTPQKSTVIHPSFKGSVHIDFNFCLTLKDDLKPFKTITSTTNMLNERYSYYSL